MNSTLSFQEVVTVLDGDPYNAEALADLLRQLRCNGEAVADLLEHFQNITRTWADGRENRALPRGAIDLMETLKSSFVKLSSKTVRGKAAEIFANVGLMESQLGVVAIDIAHTLLSAVRHDVSRGVKAMSAFALSRYLNSAKLAVPDLREEFQRQKNLGPEHIIVAIRVALALFTLGEVDEAWQWLMRLPESSVWKDSQTRFFTFDSFATIGELRLPAEGSLPHLILGCEDSVSDNRRVAVSALGKIRKGSREVITALVNRLKDADQDVTMNAVRALGRLGSDASEAIAALEHVAANGDDKLKVAAAAAIDRIRGTCPTYVGDATFAGAATEPALADSRRSMVSENSPTTAEHSTEGTVAALQRLDDDIQSLTRHLENSTKRNDQLVSRCATIVEKLEKLLTGSNSLTMANEPMLQGRLKVILDQLNEIEARDDAARQKAQELIGTLEGEFVSEGLVDLLRRFLKSRGWGVISPSGETAGLLWQRDRGASRGGYLRFAYTKNGKPIKEKSLTRIPKLTLILRPDSRRRQA